MHSSIKQTVIDITGTKNNKASPNQKVELFRFSIPYCPGDCPSLESGPATGAAERSLLGKQRSKGRAPGERQHPRGGGPHAMHIMRLWLFGRQTTLADWGGDGPCTCTLVVVVSRVLLSLYTECVRVAATSTYRKACGKKGGCGGKHGRGKWHWWGEDSIRVALQDPEVCALFAITCFQKFWQLFAVLPVAVCLVLVSSCSCACVCAWYVVG